MALQRFFRSLPIADRRVGSEALADLRLRLQQSRTHADAEAAHRSMCKLQMSAEFCSEEGVLFAMRMGVGRSCCGAPPSEPEKVWTRRVHLNEVRLVLMPLAAWRVQGAWRRHCRLEKARRQIQEAVLNFLWRPHSWACLRGCVDIQHVRDE